MSIRFANLWEYLRSSFWFIPVIMTVMAVLTAIGMLRLDEVVDISELERSIWFYTGGSENARAILSTIASSMITVAGVVFSITIVALSLSSSQFGPRLLRTFMKDMSTQMVLGSFVATYIYCLVVLRNVVTREDTNFVPNISIAFAIILTITNILVLIYFIHHVSTSIQADKVIDRVYNELKEGMDRLFPDELGKDAEERSREENGAKAPEFLLKDHVHTTSIRHEENGYIQAIDNEALWELTTEGDLLMELHYRPGQYVVAGSAIVTLHGKHLLPDGMDKKIKSTFILGYIRTSEQDIEFLLDQLNEVALRALSPSLNDPFTAITCIDRLCSVVCHLAGRKFPSPYRYDDAGTLRMIGHERVNFDQIFKSAFSKLRQSAGGNEPVLYRLLWAMSTILDNIRVEAHRELVLREIKMIHTLCQETIPEANDQRVATALIRDNVQADAG